MGGQPRAGAAMQRGDHFRPPLLGQPPQQQRLEQVVIAIPRPLFIQRHQKEAATSHMSQGQLLTNRLLAGDGLAQRIAQSIQDGRLQQKVQHRARLEGQDFIQQKVHHEAMVTLLKGASKRGRVWLFT